MATQNVETDLDITNGARGTIFLSPDEPVILQLHTTIKLQHVPLYVLVKLSRTRATQLEGLEYVILVEPTSRTPEYTGSSTCHRGKVNTRTVKRC